MKPTIAINKNSVENTGQYVFGSGPFYQVGMHHILVLSDTNLVICGQAKAYFLLFVCCKGPQDLSILWLHWFCNFSVLRLDILIFTNTHDVTCVTFNLVHFEHPWYFGFCHDRQIIPVDFMLHKGSKYGWNKLVHIFIVRGYKIYKI